jgi:hypothetical protein
MNVDKLIFFNKGIKDKEEICTSHFNDFFLKFCDKFYPNKSHKTSMADFKKCMKDRSMLDDVELVKCGLDYIDRIDYGIRVEWSFIYTLKTDN